MKKLKWFNLAILAIIVAFGFVMAACSDEGSGDDGIFNDSKNDSVKVRNMTNTSLVAFKGEIKKELCLGGVRPGGEVRNLLYGSNLLGDDPTQFKMIFITEDQYKSGYNASTPIFTQMYVFWNGNVGDNSKIYEVSKYLGGDYEIQIWNTSNYDVEFRVDGIAGPTLGFAPSGMTLTKLRAGAGDYIVYPIFQRINKLRDIIETVVPRYSNGNAIGWEVEFGQNKQPVSLNLQTALTGISETKLGAACVVISNSAESGVRFFQGVTPMVTPAGTYVIMDQQAFIIDMPVSPNGKNYSDSRIISNFKIQNMGFSVDVVDEDGSKEFTLETDKQYVITTSGSGPADTLKAVINIKNPDKFEVEELDPEGAL